MSIDLERNSWPFVSLTRISELNWVRITHKIKKHKLNYSISFWDNFKASCNT